MAGKDLECEGGKGGEGKNAARSGRLSFGKGAIRRVARCDEGRNVGGEIPRGLL